MYSLEASDPCSPESCTFFECFRVKKGCIKRDGCVVWFLIFYVTFLFPFFSSFFFVPVTAYQKRNNSVLFQTRLYTDVVLFFFLFFSKTSASARESKIFSFSPTTTPLRWRSINPPRFLFLITLARTLARKQRVCEQAISRLVLYSEWYQQTCTSIYRKQ